MHRHVLFLFYSVFFTADWYDIDCCAFSASMILANHGNTLLEQSMRLWMRNFTLAKTCLVLIDQNHICLESTMEMNDIVTARKLSRQCSINGTVAIALAVFFSALSSVSLLSASNK